jgi:hypothetical protein
MILDDPVSGLEFCTLGSIAAAKPLPCEIQDLTTALQTLVLDARPVAATFKT